MAGQKPYAIDVTRGGGELGQEFYVGESIALASAWSKGRHGQQAAVLKIDIDDAAYVSLNTSILNLRQYVYRLWQRLLNKNFAYTYHFHVDVVCAPFATIQFSYQYKFESKKAQQVLNNNTQIQIL